MSFNLSLDRKRQVDRHLVTIEVRVESFTDQRVQVDRVTFNQRRFERLDSHPMQRRSTVQQNRVVLNHLLKDIPNLFVLPLKHLLRGLDRIGVPHLFEPANNERLEQLKRDLLR